MIPPLDRPSVPIAVTRVFADAGWTPAPRSVIVPLARLVGSYNLACVELPHLTGVTILQELARRGGVLAPRDPLPSGPLAGFLYAVGGYGSIFVHAPDPVARRRFTIAHELGHYLLHFRPLQAALDTPTAPVELVDLLVAAAREDEDAELPQGAVLIPRPGAQEALLPPLNQMEAEANQFAAEVLMPESLVRTLTGRYQRAFGADDLVRRLATDLLVSRAAIRRRLRDLALVDGPT
jgi:hypothetical protein